ncbi:hypothetical protein ACSHDR_000781 [Cronobacter sakazakii]|uniref:hypothetical protein n=1 Tax=Cronobacter sakazakii TaxID=28141 RepID=UPI001CEDF2C0|nr:hypothetical protein [Cronobacter sakazakii]
MDKSREQFEAWWCQYADEPIEYVEGQRSTIGGYYNEFIDRAWHAWKASREAIEIELDAKVMVDDEFDKGHNCAIGYCTESIRAAGLKVKGE